jgi:hypothetical protein
VLELLVVRAGPLILLAWMLVTVPGRPPFTTNHLVAGEEIIGVGTSIPVDVHPTRDLFSPVAHPSMGGASR